HLIEEGKNNRKSHNIQSQAIALKLYRLAASAVPWDNSKGKYKPDSPNGELNFLHDAIIEGNTWATFMRFSEKWRNQRNVKALESFLPCIDGFDDDENIEDTVTENETGSALAINKKHDEEIEKLRGSLNKTKILAYIIIGLLAWIILLHKF